MSKQYLTDAIFTLRRRKNVLDLSSKDLKWEKRVLQAQIDALMWATYPEKFRRDVWLDYCK